MAGTDGTRPRPSCLSPTDGAAPAFATTRFMTDLLLNLMLHDVPPIYEHYHPALRRLLPGSTCGSETTAFELPVCFIEPLLRSVIWLSVKIFCSSAKNHLRHWRRISSAG